MNLKLKKNYNIGIILNSLSVSKFEYETIQELILYKKNFNLVLLLEKNAYENFTSKLLNKIQYNSFWRLFEFALFKFLYFLEFFFLSLKLSYLNELKKNHLISKKDFNKVIEIEPIFSGNKTFVQYKSEDLKILGKEKLDIILRVGGSGIYKGKILKTSRLGIMSFHHGDNTWNRGLPPAFWEVVLKKPSTGFIIQILNEKLDDGLVIFKGEFATKNTYLHNLYNLYSESNKFFVKTLIKYLEQNKKVLSSINSKKNNKYKIFRSPNIYFIIKYLIILLKFVFFQLKKNYIQQQTQRYQVGYLENDWTNVNFVSLKKIRNLNGSYFADPFVINKKNKNYIFVEEFIKSINKGVISTIELDKEGNQRLYRNIIKESFHLSFPYIFEFKNSLYMVPESNEAKCIRLYKCIKFPNKWQYCYNLMNNINCVDSIIFKKSNYYWLINTLSNKNDFSSQLNIFYSKSPISKKWKAHKKNPVIFDSTKGRNAGIIIRNNNIYRISQSYGYNNHGIMQYGQSTSINKIIKINNNDYKEIVVKKINPIFKKDIVGTHHLNSIKNLTVIDYCFYDRY